MSILHITQFNGSLFSRYSWTLNTASKWPLTIHVRGQAQLWLPWRLWLQTQHPLAETDALTVWYRWQVTASLMFQHWSCKFELLCKHMCDIQCWSGVHGTSMHCTPSTKLWLYMMPVKMMNYTVYWEQYYKYSLWHTGMAYNHPISWRGELLCSKMLLVPSFTIWKIEIYCYSNKFEHVHLLIKYIS